MDNEDPEPVAPPTDARPDEMTRTEARLRRLSGRKGAYDGPLVAVARGWVSHDSRFHFLSARFLGPATIRDTIWALLEIENKSPEKEAA